MKDDKRMLSKDELKKKLEDAGAKVEVKGM